MSEHRASPSQTTPGADGDGFTIKEYLRDMDGRHGRAIDAIASDVKDLGSRVAKLETASMVAEAVEADVEKRAGQSRLFLSNRRDQIIATAGVAAVVLVNVPGWVSLLAGRGW